MKKGIILVFLLFGNMFSLIAQSRETERYAMAQIKNYYNSESWSSVVDSSTDYLAQHPFSTYNDEIRFFQAVSFFHLNILTESQFLLEELLLHKSLDAKLEREAYYWLALILSKQEMYEQALAYYYLLVQEPFEDERDKKVLLYTAQSLSMLRRTDELTAVIEFYIRQYGDGSIPLEVEPLLGSLWLGMGIEAYEAQRYTEALEYFKRADLQKVEGEKSPVHYEQSGLYQAIVHYLEGDTDLALSILESRINYDGSTLFEYASLLSIMYGEESNKIKSELYASDALEVFNTDPEKFDYDTSFFLLQSVVYQYAAILYEQKDFIAVNNLVETFISHYDDVPYYIFSDNITLLNAQSLYKSGNTIQALQLFERLQFSYYEEHAKALFLSGQWARGADIALKANDIYLQGIAYYYLENWDLAYERFSGVFEDENEIVSSWSMYYAILAQYFSGNYDEILNLIQRFVTDFPFHKKIWDVHTLASTFALESGDAKLALEYSLAAIRSAKTNEQKQMASLFSAGLYMDSNRYNEALNLLNIYTRSSDNLSIAPRMLLSQVYVAMDDIQKADKELQQIITLFPNEPLAREAAYKRGELYYTDGSYAQAERLFREFRFAYPSGVYTDFALYFEAESRLNQDDSNGAILLFTDLVQRYTTSSYRFASINQLVFLHRGLREYRIALDYALQAKSNYPQDFASSQLQIQINELTVLASGADDEIAQTLFSWQSEGENTTPDGRKIGYDLAVLYLQNSGDQSRALELLEDLDSVLQGYRSEYVLHARVLDSLGSIEREQGNCAQSGRYYLQKIEVLVGRNMSEESAKAFYSAIEAFDCAGMSADANAVFEEMKNNYSDSIWHERASVLLIK